MFLWFHGTLSELVVDATATVSDFSVVCSLVGVGDSHDVYHGGWEVSEQGFNSLGKFGLIGEEWKVSINEFNGLVLYDCGISGYNNHVLGNVGDSGDDGLEVEGFNSLLEDREETGQEGCVVDHGHVFIDSDGGVGFFNESEESEMDNINVEGDFVHHVSDITELSDSSWDGLSAVNQDLEHVSEEGSNALEIFLVIGSLDLDPLDVESEQVSEDTVADFLSGEVAKLNSNGFKERLEGQFSFGANSDRVSEVVTEKGNSLFKDFWFLAFTGKDGIKTSVLGAVD